MVLRVNSFNIKEAKLPYVLQCQKCPAKKEVFSDQAYQVHEVHD